VRPEVTRVPTRLSPARRRGRAVALASAGLFLLLPACELGEAEVVTRPPPAVIAPDAKGDMAGPDAGRDARAPADGPATAREARAPTDASQVAGEDAPDAPAVEAAPAAGEAGPPGDALAPCQAPDLVFCDDFERGSAAWRLAGERWSIIYDRTAAQPNAVYGPSVAATGRATVAQAAWQDMTVQARVRVLSFGHPTVLHRAEVYARYQDGDRLYAVGLRGDGKLGLRKNTVAIGNIANAPAVTNEWHVLGIKVSGPPGATTVAGYLDGRMLATASDTDDSGGPSSAAGSAGIGVYGETLAVFDDVKVSSP
jgi:hypothetical protein